MKKQKKRISLRNNMIRLMVLGWVLPVLLLTALVGTYVTDEQNEQILFSLEASMAKAADLYDLQLSSAETASKNASYYSDIRATYLDFQKNRDRKDLSDHVETFLKSEYKYNKMIRSAVALFPDENITEYTYNNAAGGSFKNITYFQENVKEEVLGFYEDLNTKTQLLCHGGHVYLVRNLVLTDYHPYCVLVLELNNESLLEGFQSVLGYSRAEFLLDDLYMAGEESLRSEFAAMPTKPVVRLSDATSFYRGNMVSYILMKETRYGGELTYLVEVENKVLFAQTITTWLVFALVLIVMFPLVHIMFVFYRKNVTKPVETLTEAYDRVAANDYGYQITEPAGNEEFYRIQQSFNEMSGQIKAQFDRIIREEIALRDAKIMALQSQINPHFLNNTFEIINWEARLNGNIKVSKMIEALSTMLEATMNRRGDQMHALREEITYVDAYAYIISERLGERFRYEKNLDETLLDAKVPKLIVQPIVENAVEHGLAKVQKGIVSLSVFGTEEYLIIEVVNDGNMSEEDKARVERLLSEQIDPEQERSLSLGIRNVNNRLRLIYGDDCGLFMENREDKTVSTIRLKRETRQEQQ